MELIVLAEQLGKKLMGQHLKLVTAESCTGGWVAEAVTAIPGSSEWFERGFVTYSNIAKQEMLGINKATLAQFGAVSEQVAREMVQGALARSYADIALSVTGIAGPEGGTSEKPVGTVWFGFAQKEAKAIVRLKHFTGDREAIRRRAVEYALNELLSEFF